MVFAALSCLALGYWQYLRAESGNSLSWAYVFEWPFFAAVVVYFWWDLIHHPEIEQAEPAANDVLPPGWYRAQVKGELITARPALAEDHLPGAVLPASRAVQVVGNGNGTVEVLAPPPGGAPTPEEREEADKLAAYNRYLAELALNGKPKRW